MTYPSYCPELPNRAAASFSRLCLLAIVLTTAALAASDTDPRRTFNIPATTAEIALKLFSEQSGRGVIFSTDNLKGVKTNPVRGELTVRAAIDQIIARTGLIVTQDDDTGSFAIRRSPAGPNIRRGPADPNVEGVARSAPPRHEPSDEVAVMLSPFEVSSERDDGYKATNALSGTRFNTNLLDLPKPVEVITSEFIADIGATDMYEATRYAAGVEANSAPGQDDITGSNFAVRGISVQTTTYRNGYRSFGIVDPVTIARIEIIKGPSSVFSGTIEPGGTINVITKKPARTASQSMKLRYGSYERLRTEVVATGPIDTRKKLAYRAAWVHEDHGSPYDFAGRRRGVYAVTLDYRLTERSTLTFDSSYIENFVRPSARIAYFNSTLINPAIVGLEPNVRPTFTRQGPHAFSDLKQVQANLEFTHLFNENWSLRVGTYYRYQDLARLLVGGSTRVSTNATTRVRTVARIGTWEPDAESYVHAPQAYLTGKYRYGGFDHRMIVGYEYTTSPTRNDVYRRVLTPIDIDNPTLESYAVGDPTTYAPSDLRRTESIEQGYSLNNVWRFWNGRGMFLQGMRYGTFESERRNLKTNLRSTLSDSALAQSYGLSGRVFPKMSLFVSYSESFAPQTLFDFNGQLLAPVRGKGTDVGLKYDIVGGRLSGSVVAFDITRANAPTPDTDHPGFFIADAESRARGFETSLLGRPLDQWSIVASYAYLLTAVIKENRAHLIGLRTSNVPRHQFSIWNRYRVSTGRLKGLAAGVGVSYKGNRRGNASVADRPGLQLESYTRWDANLSYQFKLGRRDIGLTFSVANLTDLSYQVNANGFAEPRSYTGSVSVRF